MHLLEGNVIDVESGTIFPGTIEFDKRIVRIRENGKSYAAYICPGYIDPHIHIESTMMPPSHFSNVVAPHGTSAVVADPHEIANVLGMRGIRYMVEDAAQAMVDVYFTAPSCVPATQFETSGAKIGPGEVRDLLAMERFVALGEMMDYPGIVAGDADCTEKVNIAKKLGKPIDGHCPCLGGRDLEKYVSAGISTDHECSSLPEAEEKAKLGMKVLIREGSSARNLKNLIGFDEAFSFCTDDMHVEDLITQGHIDRILSMAVDNGKDPLDALRMATLNPASHYSLEGGRLGDGGPANMLVLDSLEDFTPSSVFFHGEKICQDGRLLRTAFCRKADMCVMGAKSLGIGDIQLPNSHLGHTIGAIDGELVTNHIHEGDPLGEGAQKIIVVDRYHGNNVSVAQISGLGLKDCALAQTIAHDSHNIIATGSSDELLVRAINALISLGGGIVACSSHDQVQIGLDIGGLMATAEPEKLSDGISVLKSFLRDHGAVIENPITTLSFMALPVIPHLKLTDRGLFDVDSFKFIDNDY